MGLNFLNNSYVYSEEGLSTRGNSFYYIMKTLSKKLGELKHFTLHEMRNITILNHFLYQNYETTKNTLPRNNPVISWSNINFSKKDVFQRINKKL